MSEIFCPTFRHRSYMSINNEHYKILNSSEIAPKTGAGDGAVQQVRALSDSLTASTATLGVMT